MTLVGYKTRPRLQSWDQPEPPPPKRSRLLLLALVAWLATTYVGFRWLQTTDAPLTANDGGVADDERPEVAPAASEPAPTARATSEEKATTPPRATTSPLPPCQSFLSEARSDDSERIPTHLGRSVLDGFLGDSTWTRPCHGSKRRSTVRFCAAIRDGSIVGLTLESTPKSLGLEECIREQAQKVSVRSEPVVRIVDISLAL